VLPNPSFGPRRYRPSERVPEEAGSRVSPPGQDSSNGPMSCSPLMSGVSLTGTPRARRRGTALSACGHPLPDSFLRLRRASQPPSGAPPILTLNQLVMKLHQCRVGLPVRRGTVELPDEEPVTPDRNLPPSRTSTVVSFPQGKSAAGRANDIRRRRSRLVEGRLSALNGDRHLPALRVVGPLRRSREGGWQ
jgi:hypothetical protein